MSRWFTPSSTARRSTARAVARSGRSPRGQPVSFIVPYPILATLRSPPNAHRSIVTTTNPKAPE
ncbi:hypothetical protein GCM10029978_093860 [Actinoallomurus acanthiterrae]